MTIGAGELNVFGELQAQSRTRTSAGGVTPGWAKERDIWFKLEGLTGRLALEARAREPALTHRLIVRQEDDVDATKRIVVGTRVFRIDGTPEDVDERHRFVRFMATEGVAT